MATVVFTACNEDYTDWASPQTNSQEEAAAAYDVEVSTAAGAENIKMPTASEYVSLITFGNASEAITEINVRNLTINNASIGCEIEGNDVKVRSAEIDSLLEYSNWTRESKTYDLAVKAELNVTLATGETFVITKETNSKLTTAQTPAIDPNGYALLGDFVGHGWDPTNPIWMTEKSAGVYEAIVETAGTENWFKFYRGSAFSDLDFQWDAVAYGCAVNGDASTSNLLTWQDDPIWSLQTPVINKIGKWVVTLDMNTFTYSVREAADALFLTGNHYGWGSEWKELTPVWGTNDTFWIIIYLHEGEQFKFAPQAGWGNDFGMSAQINDVAGAGVSGDDNINIANAGWYLLKVVNGATRSVDFLKAEVYLIGETSPTNWSVGEAGLFTPPSTEDGDFVSPAFISSNEVRMCISLDGYDWWKTEFIVNADGKIDYRGKGDDQNRVWVEAGQKAYLNFTTGTGSYK